MTDYILLIRKCKNCDDGIGKVNGELVHRNGKYACKVKVKYNEDTGRSEETRTVAE